MNKIQKWLIHKLGGFSELPIYEPNIVAQKTCDVIPIASRLRVGKDEYFKFSSYYEEKVCRELCSRGCCKSLCGKKVVSSMMDRKEAVERIKIHMGAHKIGKYPHIKLGEALLLAIEALQEPQVGGWIPVSERLPEETQDEYYPLSLVTLDNGDVCLGVYRYDDKEWWTRMSEGETVYTKDHKVTAWQPLPKPYKESEE